MSIPRNARVRAVPNFLGCLRSARQFMEEQEAGTAAARFRKLQAEIDRARGLLSFAPESGRPTGFLDAKSGWGRFQAEQALGLARALGMPGLRELVLARHAMLYAHSDSEVVLLSLHQEQQLRYRMGK